MARRRRSRRKYAEVDDSHVRCRTYGHAWDEFNPIDKGPPYFGWRLSLRCIRCLTERHDTIDGLGRVGARRYEYPDGYKLAGMTDRPAMRREMKIRFYASAEAMATAMAAAS